VYDVYTLAARQPALAEPAASSHQAAVRCSRLSTFGTLVPNPNARDPGAGEQIIVSA